MPGTAWSVAQSAPTGTASRDGKRRYTVPLIVQMSDPADGPNCVLDYLAGQNIYIGSVYHFGNDRDDFAFCDGLTPRREPMSATKWTVDATYSPMDEEQENQTPDGEYSEEPEEWRWQHAQGYSTWQEPCWQAWNDDAFPSIFQAAPPVGAYARQVDTQGPVVNSAGLPVDPTLMRDIFDRVWQVTCFSRQYDPLVSDTYMGALNADWVKYQSAMATTYKLKQPTGGWLWHRVKCTNAAATFRTATFGRTRVDYWEWNWEFRFRNLPGGWLESVLDRGLTARADEGMPDGLGGQMGALPAAAAPAMPVIDGIGRRVPELVLFDGAGRPLQSDDANASAGYFFRWRKDYKVAFADIPFKFFQPN